MKQVIVDSLLTSYLINGSGKTVLLLHGWGDDAKTFNNLMKQLAANYQVVVLDLPGFGNTQAPNETWKLDNYAQFVSHFLQKLQVQPYIILGHSNGGAIALRGLSQGNLMADRLILLASAGIRDEYKGRKKVLRLAAKGAKVLTAPLPKQVQHKLKRFAYNKIGSDLFVAEHLQETFKNVVTDDVRADAEKVNIPALLIYGSADTATPPRYGELLAQKLSNAHLQIIQGAGHAVHQEAPDQVQSLIEEFIV